MDLVTLRSIFTVLVFVAFIGVWIWAWSSKRKQAFDEAANLPFVEDGTDTNTHTKGLQP
ncbi:MAG: cbb3-type cytochrome c oxidase subunit 3 [Gammaproteobacteria bacterium]|nr:cbb3-type cytochrome c oxidase subunit 3 [Gammaproteobacteria bacterium]MBU2477895.1 cbb3-type cytochrome c oxidase subunit 3 [Gammaproteobacteria bacterium]